MEKENLIFKMFKEKGFCDVGICNADSFESLRQILTQASEKLSGFVENDIEKRINPKISMPEAKSIIVGAKSYKMSINVNKDYELRGQISIGAIGEDYHIFMKRALGEISQALEKEFGCKCIPFSDTGPLCDRELAIRSGIGYRGKSGAVITEKGGAAVFIGYIITDLDIETTEMKNKACSAQCKKCITACPTEAINKGGFEIEKCISYLTQKKGMLSLSEMKMIGKSLYGCDVCQMICPNGGQDGIEITVIDEIMPKIEFILGLSNKEFDRKYKNTSMGWRGNSVIKRNALAVLGNINKRESLVVLEKYLFHDNLMLRHTAVRAVINLIGEGQSELKKEGQAQIRSLLDMETNEEIRREIKWAIGTRED